ncbi:hypothetical protein LguiA_026679 [Lonicera macranthoides]
MAEQPMSFMFDKSCTFKESAPHNKIKRTKILVIRSSTMDRIEENDSNIVKDK